MAARALLTSMLALGVLGMVGCQADDDRPATPRLDVHRSCGDLSVDEGYPTLTVEVIEGSTPCSRARRVMQDFYIAPGQVLAPGVVRVGRWTCSGPEGLAKCRRGKTTVIGAHFSDRPPPDRAAREPAIAKLATDPEAGVSFLLDRRVLSARVLPSAPRRTRRRVRGARIRATCGRGFLGGPGLLDRQIRTRLWPAGRARVRFRFPGDIAGLATWCRLEDPKIGHVAFVKFDDALRPILWSANRWAEVVAKSPGMSCVYETQPVCERIVCERAGGRPIPHCKRPSAEFRHSFADARIAHIAIRGERAAVRFSNGEAVDLVENVSGLDDVPWWISKIGGNAGRGILGRLVVTGAPSRWGS